MQESLQYLSTRLKWCFSELSQTVEAVSPPGDDEAEECGGLFVQRMDRALEILAAVKVEDEFHEIVSLVKNIIEEVLCHAMAIAQVSVPRDSANVSSCCQKVRNKSNKPNGMGKYGQWISWINLCEHTVKMAPYDNFE